MSNPLVDAALQINEDNKKREALLAEQRLLKIRDLKEDLLNVFSKEITNSFDFLELTPNGDYVNYKAVLIYDSVSITVSISVGINSTCAQDTYLRLGNETLARFLITVPRDTLNALNERNKIQTDNERKLIGNLSTIIGKRIEELKKSKPYFWKNEIPRNYSGASRALQLLGQLEADKVFLSEEEYTEALTTLNRVIVDAEIENKRVTEENTKFQLIVKEEYERWQKETKEYELMLQGACKVLAQKYFHSWTLYSVTYMAENIDPKDLRDEEGELINDVSEALSWQCHYIGEADSEGFLTCVDVYGNLRKRKISTNIVHIEKTEFTNYPEQINVNFWKRIIPDKSTSGISFLVPPDSNVLSHEYPEKPRSWDETAKERGVKEPWKYRT
jgi:hypothetical protein